MISMLVRSLLVGAALSTVAASLSTLGGASLAFAQPSSPGSNTVGQDPNAPPQPGAPSNGTTAVTPAPDQAKPAEKKEKEKSLFDFHGSSVFITPVSANTDVFFPSTVLTPNKTVDASISFSPRWSFSKNWQLRGNMRFFYEYTSSDSTTKLNEPRFGDALLGLWFRGIPSFGGFKVQPFLNMLLPTSPESQARTLLVQPSIGAQISKGFEHFLGGEALMAASVSYGHPFVQYTTPGRNNPRPYSPSCFGAAEACAGQLSGQANASDIIAWNAFFVPTWGHFSPGIFFLMSHQFLYKFTPLPGESGGLGDDASGIRQSFFFNFFLDYEVNSWLTAEVGYTYSNTIRGGDGKYVNPIFSPYGDMRFYLGANIQLDGLYETLTGGAGEGGIVRTQNDKPSSPITRF